MGGRQGDIVLQLPTQQRSRLRSVDNSESAFLSEDFPGSRWWYQRQAANSLCAHYAIQSNGSDGAHIRSNRSSSSRGLMCIVAAGDAKLHHPPSPLKGCDSALASLSSLRMSDGQQSQYSSALRLAAVSLLSCNHASMFVCKEVLSFWFPLTSAHIL